MSKIYKFFASKLTPKGYRTDSNNNNENCIEKVVFKPSSAENTNLDLSELQISKSTLTNSLELNDECLLSFKKVLECSFVQSLPIYKADIYKADLVIRPCFIKGGPYSNF